jgi:hypothetical protein
MQQPIAVAGSARRRVFRMEVRAVNAKCPQAANSTPARGSTPYRLLDGLQGCTRPIDANALPPPAPGRTSNWRVSPAEESHIVHTWFDPLNASI